MLIYFILLTLHKDTGKLKMTLFIQRHTNTRAVICALFAAERSNMGACFRTPAENWQYELDELVNAAVGEWASPCAYKRYKMNRYWQSIALHLKTYDIAIAPHASIAVLCDTMHVTMLAPDWMTLDFASGMLLLLEAANDAFAFHVTNAALMKPVAARAIAVYQRTVDARSPALLRAQLQRVTSAYMNAYA
jgi:hypothetical protein